MPSAPLHLYDTAARSVVEVVPTTPGVLRMYACGAKQGAREDESAENASIECHQWLRRMVKTMY